MIIVTRKKNGFTIEGHADYAPHGEDIVCAGVSALAQSTANILNKRYNASIATSEGYLDWEYEESNTHIQVIEEAFMDAIQHIDQWYPGHIKIIDRRDENE